MSEGFSKFLEIETIAAYLSLSIFSRVVKDYPNNQHRH